MSQEVRMNLPQLALSQTRDSAACLSDVARTVCQRLRNGAPVSRQGLKRLMTEAFGDDDAGGLSSLIHDARFQTRSGHLLPLAVLRGRPASLAFVSPRSD